jgi:hypothetical protein
METYVRGLETLNQTEESYGSFLVPVILRKLPSKTKWQEPMEVMTGHLLICGRYCDMSYQFLRQEQTLMKTGILVTQHFKEQ